MILLLAAVDVSRRILLSAAGPGAALQAGLEELDDLLGNWEDRTRNCRFAEVNSELLKASRKSELLEEATKNALMQKDGKAVRTVCKRDPEQVRLAFGLDSKVKEKSGVPAAFARPGVYEERPPSPLVDADRLIRQGRDLADDPEAYVDAEERWLSAISALDAASYASGAADFGAILSTTEGNAGLLDGGAKQAAREAREALALIVSLLNGSS